MKTIIFCTCFFLALSNYVQAGRYSTCGIEGIKDDEWSSYNLKMPIKDTYRGELATFKTFNILRMKIESLNYINATWEDQTLKLFTSDDFENYEKKSEYTRDPKISIVLNFVCTEGSTDFMTFRQPVIDINNYTPILNKNRYEYSFGMTVPNDLKLTDFIPIKAFEYDITNTAVYFTMEENDYFELTHQGKNSYKTKEFSTTLTTRKNITAPFNQTFTLVVSDDGHPVRNTSVPLTIAVSTPQELEKKEQEKIDDGKVKGEEAMVHPPIFAKHLYFADYTFEHVLKMEEPIIIKYGAESNTQLKQKGYEQYFRVRFEDSNNEKVVVDKLISLPSDIIKSTDIITIEIEAVNAGLHMPGRTALIIRLPNLGKINSSGNPTGNSGGNTNGNSKECDLTVKYGYFSRGATTPLVLFLLAVFSIVSINIYVAIMFVNKDKARR